MNTKLNALCLAVALGVSGQAMAACSGLAGGASAYLDGETLKVKGSRHSEQFTLSKSGDTLTVTRKVGSSSSCEVFFMSQISALEARLGNGADSFNASNISVPQTLYGQYGNDTLISGNQNDRLYGGRGNDTLKGNSGNDQLFGEDGSDTLHGGWGNDQLKGGNHHDKLFGDYNDDTLWGDDGGDLLMGGQGTDVLYGGNDNDYLGGGCRLSNANNSYIYEQSSCNSNRDGNDKLYGGAGHDVLSGDKGNDTLYGEDGNDYLTGNGGREDRLHGGNGNDALYENGDGNPNSLRWHKAWGNNGDDILFTNGENSNQEGGKDNDVIITSSSGYEAKIHGGKSADFIWTADAAPQGTCGKGDDKGMVFLNSCEGTTWVKDYQGLLSKVDNRSNFNNPYYEAANAVVEMSGEYSGYNNGWRSLGVRPTPLYDIVSSAVFGRWLSDQSTLPYSYYEWRVDYNVGSSGIYGTYFNCMENNVAYMCRHIIQQTETCYNSSGDSISCS
ncbi:sodium:calcium exchanger [Pseudoalteromonas rubra]|uniref:Sodium:calcium exchanger n=1 Tax=Pseudoalteromonas rubra TaxID=43658 RepID=A0A5S3WIC2_9GAMM|nr:calcium-binding protein [Pseudoalteromonas rubra]TMP26142.1 sodium:calcium exchanger [Pseudoalteromonas rubra]TMP32945.1 sodium:calcium exchanger [Pseudoalteromonas rubra]